MTEEALRVLGACVVFERSDGMVGGAAIDACGDPLPPATLALCQSADAVFPAVGDRSGCIAEAAGAGLLALRKGLAVYANLSRRGASVSRLATP